MNTLKNLSLPQVKVITWTTYVIFSILIIIYRVFCKMKLRKECTHVVSEIGIPTYPKSARHLSQLTDRSRTKHIEATDHFPDPKRRRLTTLLREYSDTRGKLRACHPAVQA